MRVIEDNQNGQTIAIAIGETVEIRLAENASTGFRWTLLSSGEPICAVIREKREPGGTATPGASGQHTWLLQAHKVGECDFTLAYRRPWQQGSSPAREFGIHVRVTA